VVYRAGFVEIDDASVWFVGVGGAAAVDRFQRLVRGRAGALFVAWSGSRPSSGVAEAAGPIGLAAAGSVHGDAIAAAAARALELMTPGTPPDGDFGVVLDPSVTAAIADAGVADVMTIDAWRRADLGARGAWRANQAITIADDPGTSCYGGYAFADDGAPAERAVLVDRGAPGAPIVAMRRAGFAGPLRASAAHVTVDPGKDTLDELQISSGAALLVEDAGVARVDPIAWQIVVPVGRARRLEAGRRTGHVFADLELRASVPALLGAVTGATAEVHAISRRTDLGAGGAPMWRSATAPHIATRAHIAPRGRRNA
jgi:predicted Zn-dependent protease